MGGTCWDPAFPIDDWFPNDHDVFDPATGIWSTSTPWHSSSYIGAAAIGRRILAVDVGEGVHVYDVATDAWTIHRAVTEDPEYGDMPGGFAAFQGSLYMLGGGNSLPDPTCGRIAYPLHTVRRFDLAALSRDRAPSMITARTDLVAVEVDGVIFAFGGTTGWSRCTGTDGTLSSVERLVRAR